MPNSERTTKVTSWFTFGFAKTKKKKKTVRNNEKSNATARISSSIKRVVTLRRKRKFPLNIIVGRPCQIFRIFSAFPTNDFRLRISFFKIDHSVEHVCEFICPIHERNSSVQTLPPRVYDFSSWNVHRTNQRKFNPYYHFIPIYTIHAYCTFDLKNVHKWTSYMLLKKITFQHSTYITVGLG